MLNGCCALNFFPSVLMLTVKGQRPSEALSGSFAVTFHPKIAVAS